MEKFKWLNQSLFGCIVLYRHDDITVKMNVIDSLVKKNSMNHCLNYFTKGSVVDWCNTQRQYKQKGPMNNETMNKDSFRCYNGNINLYLSHFPRKTELLRTWHLALTFDFN